MTLERTAVRLWKRLTREERLAAARGFFREPPPELMGSALAAIIKARHLRPQVARSMPPEEQARALASLLEPGETVAAGLLVALHLGERRALLATFLDALRPALELWRTGRGWQPQKSRGPRVQPVVFPAGAEVGGALGELRGDWPAALRGLAASYANRLGGGPHAERYWLLLPPRESDGLERLVRSSDEAA